MTLIKERCVERACARLSAKKYQLPSRWPWRGRINFPFRVSTPMWEPALGVGSVHGMGVGRGVEVSAAVGLTVAIGVAEAVGVEEKR